MKYIPSEESEEINYKTEKHPWLNALILVAGFFGLYFILLIMLGIAGETAATSIPARYESSIFSFLDLKMGQKPWPLGQQIADDIFQRNSIDPVYKPHVFLSCNPTVNAVALPGKKIIVFRGLLDDTKSLNSLYFIMGHEIGHIINRDHLKSMGRAIAISLGLFFVTVGADTSSFFSVNQAIVDRRFGQGQEEASDDRAIDFTIKRFNGLYTSNEFFDAIQKTSPDSPKIISFLNTHPLTQGRIDKIKNHKAYNPETTIVEKMDSSQFDCSTPVQD